MITRINFVSKLSKRIISVQNFTDTTCQFMNSL